MLNEIMINIYLKIFSYLLATLTRGNFVFSAVSIYPTAAILILSWCRVTIQRKIRPTWNIFQSVHKAKTKQNIHYISQIFTAVHIRIFDSHFQRGGRKYDNSLPVPVISFSFNRAFTVRRSCIRFP